MRFTKMHGLGNDYVYIDAYREPDLEHRHWPTLTPPMSDRHTGIGGDGAIVIARPNDPRHHARMRTFNADGSESGACGNGTRCVARFVRERLGITDAVLCIESGDRVLRCEPLPGGDVRVDMGEPGLALEDVHIDARGLAGVEPPTIDIEGTLLRFHHVSMGNPHAVVFAHENPTLGDDLSALARRLGPIIEHHRAFTQRVNAHLVRIDSPGHATVHTWERGAGTTRACGTGACATLVAGVGARVLHHEAILTLPGGDLRVAWTPASQGGDGVVWQCGPAVFVFEGHWNHDHEGHPS